MGILNLDFGQLSYVEGSIKNAVTQIQRRKNDYDGIVKDVNKIATSSNNLYNCNIYLKKKSEQLQGKIDKLNSFKKKVSSFTTNAKEADRRVSNHVTDSSYTFYKAVGIKIGWAETWQNIKRGTEEIIKNIKKFYEEHKFIIDLIVDIAVLLAAVVTLGAATGIVAVFFAGFALAQAIADVFTSSVALGCHLAGDDEAAGIWAERGLKDGVQLLGSGVDWLAGAIFQTDINVFRNTFGVIYDLVNIASVGYGFYKGGKKIYDTFKDGKFKRSTYSGIKTIFGFDFKPGLDSKEKYKKVVNGVKLFKHGKQFFKNGKQVYELTRACAYIKNIKNLYNVGSSLYDGTFFTEGTKVGKDIKKAWNSFKDATRSYKSTPLPNSINFI